MSKHDDLIYHGQKKITPYRYHFEYEHEESTPENDPYRADDLENDILEEIAMLSYALNDYIALTRGHFMKNINKALLQFFDFAYNHIKNLPPIDQE